MKKIIIFVTVICSLVIAQTEDTIFPGMTGQQLLDSLIAQYKTSQNLGEARAKDSMYASIYNINDSVSCVYTDYTMYIDPTLDPSQAAYNGGAGINCEHTWPKAKGASSSSLPEWDLHHLFPTRVDVNGDRGNSPFDEIDDNLTDNWYWLEINTSSIPNQFINEYSEFDNAGDGRFEPREDHKGNVARAMFYFYTMYKAEADAADPNFFTLQKDVLWQWHNTDPADAIEISRTNQIASYQQNKPNPYVLDATLVQRAYFPTSGINDENTQNPQQFKLYQNYPNPFNPNTQIRYYIPANTKVVLEIFNVLGQQIFSIENLHSQAGEYTFTWNGIDNEGNKVGSGLYFYSINFVSSQNNQNFDIKKMILMQ
ncbi:MAG: endonuclease [Calditrichia bacterium]|nr:endonuclease [Calditrichia bacterium]